jgi:hypothetical protein
VQDDGYFDERVAARYDESSAEMFAPAAVDPAVDFLVELAGSGRALELRIGRAGSRSRSRSGACRCTGSSCRRRWSRDCAQSRAEMTSA